MPSFATSMSRCGTLSSFTFLTYSARVCPNSTLLLLAIVDLNSGLRRLRAQGLQQPSPLVRFGLDIGGELIRPFLQRHRRALRRELLLHIRPAQCFCRFSM